VPDSSSRLSRAPSRALVVIAALLVQLAGAACLVLGLAAIPITHDLHHSFEMLAVWIGGALLALVTGGLAHRGRIVPLLLASITTAGMGFVLPRGDSAVGVLANLWPHGALPEQVVVVAAIAMFAIGACCIAVLPWAVPYRAWWRDQVSPQPARTLLGIGAVVPRLTRAFALPLAPPTRRAWLVVSVAAVAVGAVVGVALVELHTGAGRDAHAEPAPRPTPVAVASPADAPAAQQPAGTASPKQLAAALDRALAASPHAAALAELLDADAFAWGTDAADVAADRDHVVALMGRTVAAGSGAELVIRDMSVSTDGSLGWIVQDAFVGDRHIAIAAIAHETGGRWTIAALCLAQPVTAEVAQHLAKTGQLAALAPLPTPHPHTADLVAAAGELRPPGAHDADATSIAAATFNARLGWTAVNVEVKHHPMRGFAAWVKDGDGWHAVLTQWSYGGPLR
jgi:hypothetical protein